MSIKCLFPHFADTVVFRCILFIFTAAHTRNTTSDELGLYYIKRGRISLLNISLKKLVIKETESIVNNFNEYFANIGPNLAAKIKNCHGNSHKNYLRNPSLLKFSFTTVDQSCISKIIDDFALENSSGHDEISNSLMKLIKEYLVIPLTLTVKQSLTTGIFPQKLKIAKVPYIKIQMQQSLKIIDLFLFLHLY